MLYGRHPWGQFMVCSLVSNQFTAEEVTTTTDVVCQYRSESRGGREPWLEAGEVRWQSGT